MHIKYCDNANCYNIEPLNLRSISWKANDSEAIYHAFFNYGASSSRRILFCGKEKLNEYMARKFVDAVANTVRFDDIFDVDKWYDEN